MQSVQKLKRNGCISNTIGEILGCVSECGLWENSEHMHLYEGLNKDERMSIYMDINDVLTCLMHCSLFASRYVMVCFHGPYAHPIMFAHVVVCFHRPLQSTGSIRWKEQQVEITCYRLIQPMQTHQNIFSAL